MPIRRSGVRTLIAMFGALALTSPNLLAKELSPEVNADIESATAQIVGAGGFGERGSGAPVEVDQFGQLVGVWIVDQEIRKRDGSWLKEPSGIWVWKYAVGGYATQDIWYQNKDRLPIYMGDLGHDYLLNALRVYDPASSSWKVAWVSNAANGGPGAVFGTFEAKMENGEIVMRGPGATEGLDQRIIFYDFTGDSFKWRSEFSQDGGETWLQNMKLFAHRVR